MKILVTGGAGFIGSHLVDALIKRGYQVRVLDNLCKQIHPNGKLPNYFNPKAEFIRGDVARRKDLEKALVGVEAIFHLAADVGVGQSMYEIAHYVKTNSLGTAILLDILTANRYRRQIKKLIVAASMSSYGEGSYRCRTCGLVRPPLRDEKNLAGRDFRVYCPNCKNEVLPVPTGEEVKQNCNSIYAITKKNQEDLVLNFGLTYVIPAVAMRYFNVYGSRQSLSNPYNGVVAIFMSRLKNKRPPIINEDGLQTRDFVHVDDVTQANIAALEKKEANYQVFNVGSGKPVTIKSVAQILAKLYQTKIQPEISYCVRKLDVRHCFADISKIKRRLDWRPRIDLQTGLEEVISWGKKIEADDRLELSLQELHVRGLR